MKMCTNGRNVTDENIALKQTNNKKPRVTSNCQLFQCAVNSMMFYNGNRRQEPLCSFQRRLQFRGAEWHNSALFVVWDTRTYAHFNRVTTIARNASLLALLARLMKERQGSECVFIQPLPPPPPPHRPAAPLSEWPCRRWRWWRWLR